MNDKTVDAGKPRLSTTDDFPRIGCLNVQTERGVIHVHDMPGLMSITVDHLKDGEIDRRSVGVLIYDPTGTEIGHPAGFLSQLSPRNARIFAESLLKNAAEVDGGRMDS